MRWEVLAGGGGGIRRRGKCRVDIIKIYYIYEWNFLRLNNEILKGRE